MDILTQQGLNSRGRGPSAGTDVFIVMSLLVNTWLLVNFFLITLNLQFSASERNVAAKLAPKQVNTCAVIKTS